ncbi:hypothetical protein K402DRAFT_418842 [Aulographum hederae CBS 113979]|uniref:Uncharacterized protein n=1 Tax=Aulographum hederae CBS 113979 TaxID=1176131 RepID=A0A6G1H7M7_9PEZI|nr:hypothetical protein K402DRAFT_418842 [Aulographum hederae CBS 113979]
MAQATGAASKRRSKSQPDVAVRNRPAPESAPVDPFELTRRLEIYVEQSTIYRSSRRKSLGTSGTKTYAASLKLATPAYQRPYYYSSDEESAGETPLSPANAPSGPLSSNPSNLARSVEFHRIENANTLFINRPRSAYRPNSFNPYYRRSLAAPVPEFNADELAIQSKFRPRSNKSSKPVSGGQTPTAVEPMPTDVPSPRNIPNRPPLKKTRSDDGYKSESKARKHSVTSNSTSVTSPQSPDSTAPASPYVPVSAAQAFMGTATGGQGVHPLSQIVLDKYLRPHSGVGTIGGRSSSSPLVSPTSTTFSEAANVKANQGEKRKSKHHEITSGEVQKPRKTADMNGSSRQSRRLSRHGDVRQARPKSTVSVRSTTSRPTTSNGPDSRTNADFLAEAQKALEAPRRTLQMNGDHSHTDDDSNSASASASELSACETSEKMRRKHSEKRLKYTTVEQRREWRRSQSHTQSKRHSAISIANHAASPTEPPTPSLNTLPAVKKSALRQNPRYGNTPGNGTPDSAAMLQLHDLDRLEEDRRRKQLAMRERALAEANRKSIATGGDGQGWTSRFRALSLGEKQQPRPSRSMDPLLATRTGPNSRPTTSDGAHKRPGSSSSKKEKRKSLTLLSSSSRRNTLKAAPVEDRGIRDIRFVAKEDQTKSMTPASLAFLEKQEKLLRRRTLEEHQLRAQASKDGLRLPFDTEEERPETPKIADAMIKQSSLAGSGMTNQSMELLNKQARRLSLRLESPQGFNFEQFTQPAYTQPSLSAVSSRGERSREDEAEKRRIREQGLRLQEEDELAVFPEKMERMETPEGGKKKKRGCCAWW